MIVSHSFFRPQNMDRLFNIVFPFEGLLKESDIGTFCPILFNIYLRQAIATDLNCIEKVKIL